MSATVPFIPFVILSALVVGCAAMMVFSRNVVHAAFWMLAAMVSTAGLYLLLSAEFLAIVQLLVYAVAVAILMIFSIMITLRRIEDAVRPRDFSAVAAALSTVFCASMLWVLRAFPQAPSQELPAVAPDVAALGKLLFSAQGWSLPFEIASLILTAALVGAVWWTKEGDE